jgi:hypothetical protein
MAELTEEQKQVRRDNLAKARAARSKRAAAEESFPAPVVAVGGEIEEVVEDEAEPVEVDEFGRFLAALDDETRELLTDGELRDIFEQQQAKAKAERKVALKKAATERAARHARIESGLMTPADEAAAALRDRMAEMVRFTVDLPELGDYGLRIDQQVFLHGFTYTVTRAQYDSFREMVWRNQQSELEFEGRSRGHWLRRQARGLEATV